MGSLPTRSTGYSAPPSTSGKDLPLLRRVLSQQLAPVVQRGLQRAAEVLRNVPPGESVEQTLQQLLVLRGLPGPVVRLSYEGVWDLWLGQGGLWSVPRLGGEDCDRVQAPATMTVREGGRGCGAPGHKLVTGGQGRRRPPRGSLFHVLLPVQALVLVLGPAARPSLVSRPLPVPRDGWASDGG